MNKTKTRLYKTGEQAPRSGKYRFVKYSNGRTTPTPTAEEKTIYLKKGSNFPPIRSANKAAWWRAI